MVLRPAFAVAKGLISIPHGIAVIATTFRLFDRWRMDRLWWDDYWALGSMVWDVAYWIAYLIRPPDGSDEQFFTFRSRVIIFWISLTCFPLTLWSARISIGASLVRVLPPGATMRKAAFRANVLFALLCIGQIVQRASHCASYVSWHRSPTVQCTLQSNIGIYNLVSKSNLIISQNFIFPIMRVLPSKSADLFADTVLVVMPLIALRKVKMPRNFQQVVLLLFATSILTTFSGVAYAVILLVSRGQPLLRIYVTITSHIEAAVSLVICNLLVLVTYFYRAYRGGEDMESYYPSSIAASQLRSYELPSQHITGVHRPGLGTTFEGRTTTVNQQTVTGSVVFTEIFADSESGYEHF